MSILGETPVDSGRVEAQRQRATEQLDLFFDLSNDLLCIAGTDGYFKRVNPAWERTFGYTSDELLARPYAEFIHPDDMVSTSGTADDLEQGRQTSGFENRYRCRDGSYRWLNWNATPTPDQGMIYAVARDITAQREAEQAQAMLAAIVADSDDAIIGKTPDGVITSWNRAAERIYGYRPEEAIGQSINLIVPRELDHEIQDILGRIANGSPSAFHDTVRVAKDGTRLHVEVTISPVRDSTGAIVGAASIARDVTARIKAEERFRRLLLAAPDAIVVTDTSGMIVLVNERTEQLFGYPRAEIEGQQVELLVPDQLRSRHVSHRDGYLAAPESRTMGPGLEHSGLRRDGSEFPVEIVVAPIDTDAGLMVAATIRDISARKRGERALAAARDEALAAARLKSQFVAMVSHEIRTPMNGVIGLTALLLGTPLQPAQKRYAEAIRTSGSALLTIINDILDVSKIEAGKMELSEAGFELNRLIETVVQVGAEASRDKDLEVVGYYPPGLPTTVRGDEGRLRQVLLNLLSNAVKFTEYGEVVLRVVQAAGAPDGRPAFTFTVNDTGIGIAPADLSLLFQPFSQVDTVANRQLGGTGLGLVITRQLVELMGGQLDVQSQPGRGSEFTFTIPLALSPEVPARHAPVREHLPARLLVVDDNPTNRQLLTEHARAWGMDPTGIPDGRSALEHLHHAAEHHQPYDVAIIDQHMPGINGVGLVHQILADPSIEGLQCVLLTTGTYQDDEAATAQGAVAVLPKPVCPSEVYNCLLELLDPAAAQLAFLSPPRGRTTGDLGLILLAEDNEINQLVAADTLTMLGYRVDIARNGIEAVELATTRSYQAILMDCQMPRMDGYTATAQLRRQEHPGQHIPIIAMTAGALPEDQQRCLDAGMDDHLAKPVDPDQLRAALTRWARITSAPSGPVPGPETTTDQAER